MNAYWIGVATITGIYLIATLGISVLTGFAGLFSMGHAGFLGIGAYVSALVTKFFGVPFYIGILWGIVAAVLIGLLIGYSTLRLDGDYFVIATLGFGEVVKLAIENLGTLTGGAKGLPDIAPGTTLPIIIFVNIIVVILLINFLKSKHGRNCIAVREEELAAKTLGIDVTKYKMIAMAISCGLCGLSGGLLAHYMQYLHPTMFSMLKSNELLITVILGGQGSLTGTIIATLILIPLPEVLRMGAMQEWRMLAYGVLVVVTIIFKPSGLMGTKELTMEKLKKFFKSISSQSGKKHNSKT